MSYNLTNLLYLVTIVTFILALRFLSSPAHARRGNQIGAIGMLVAIAVTFAKKGLTDYWAIAVAMVIGGGFGAVAARKVKMTAMPQMVALFNGVGGGAAALVSLAELHRILPEPGAPKVLVLGTRILGRAAVRLLFLVPGLLYLTETFAAVPALIIEGGSTRAALRRSEKLTGGVRMQVLGICLVIWSIAVGLTLFSGLHKGGSVGSTIWIVVYLCTRALDTSLAAVLSAMTYHHLCDRPDAG